MNKYQQDWHSLMSRLSNNDIRLLNTPRPWEKIIIDDPMIREREQKKMKQENSINETIKERGKNYGSFENVAEMSQKLKAVLLDTNTYLEPHQKEAGEMICLKLARIFAGNNPAYDDNWRDIAGYAMLGGKLEE